MKARQALILVLCLFVTSWAIADAVSVPYTPAQAQAGKKLFMQKCAECHGASLQGGTSAPALTGATFGSTDLTVSQLRAIVTLQMPLGNPGSLSPSQYAAVLAFILKYDCVAPSNGGKTQFPTTDKPQFQTIKIGASTCP
ncbi:MAG TPA: cytochrome c [Verrucomicrobiae bacterium]|nr:cytochrome c [Verrucomicrobiae bacterium]